MGGSRPRAPGWCNAWIVIEAAGPRASIARLSVKLVGVLDDSDELAHASIDPIIAGVDSRVKTAAANGLRQIFPRHTNSDDTPTWWPARACDRKRARSPACASRSANRGVVRVGAARRRNRSRVPGRDPDARVDQAGDKGSLR